MIDTFGDELGFRLSRRPHGLGGRLDFEVSTPTGGIVGRADQRPQRPLQVADRFLWPREYSASATYDITDAAGRKGFELVKRRTRAGSLDATLTIAGGRMVGRLRRKVRFGLLAGVPVDVLDADAVLVAQLVGLGILRIVDAAGEQIGGVGLADTPTGPAVRHGGGLDVRFFAGVPNETKLLCLAGLIVLDRDQHDR